MRIRIEILLLALLALVGCKKKEEIKMPVPLVKVTKAKVEDTELFKTYVGHVQATVQVEVQAQVEGVLTGYYFTEGQEVKKGDLIFTIDSRPYEAQLLKAEGGLAESIANLRYAEDVARRNAKLVQEDYVSQVQYDEYVTTVMSNKAEIIQNEADIETAKINISYCNIHAPMNAVTGRLKINVGNLISNAEATPLVVLNQITPCYAYFSVPQRDLPEIMKLHREKPLDVKVLLNGDTKNPYIGSLDLIDNQVSDQTGAIWLRGLLPNEEKMLWPGEFVDVRLILGIKKDAVLIPTEAISIGQKGKYIYVLNQDQTVKKRAVTTGQRTGSMTLIERGLSGGETVVTQGQINLKTGKKVTVKKGSTK